MPTYFGLTSRRWHSGKSIDVEGQISKADDPDVRRALYEVASALLTRFERKGLCDSGRGLVQSKDDGTHAILRVLNASRIASRASG